MKDMIMADEYSLQYISKDSPKTDKIQANQNLLEAVFKIHHITERNIQKKLWFL